MLAAAVALAAWLRTHGLAIQVVQDDEWHSIHKLMSSTYGQVLRSFGYADHSIPLTLFYKAMADLVGLDEVNMRAVQVACGIGLVALAPVLAWRATRDAVASGLYAFLLAAAPFLVLYSRFARPYAITLLLAVVMLAAIWAWRTRRTPGLAAAAASCAALSAWLHPISAMFPAIACLFVLAEDLFVARDVWRRRATQSFVLGVAIAIAMIAPLAPALWNDFGSLSAKAGGDYPGLHTLWRALSIFSGGLSNEATALVVALAALGAWHLSRTSPRLAAYLGAITILPVVCLFIVGAKWSQQGHTFARYVLPAEAVYLFAAAVGVSTMARRISARVPARTGVAACFGIAYLVLVPTLSQVARLHEWYGHLYHHYDYGDPRNNAIVPYDGFVIPGFYRKLGTMPPGSAPIIEAPFTFEAPANVFAYFDLSHHQPVKEGMLHDLCLEGPYVGEVPRDPRFRFNEFVFLDDPASVRASGARYLLLYREQLHSRPFIEGDRCMARLAALYGPPIELEPRLAVYDLRPGGTQPKLQ